MLFTALRNAFFHVDGRRNGPVAAAALSPFAGSRGPHSRRELVADVAFATLTAVFFSALSGILHLMKDEDELDKAPKENTHTTYLLSHQLMEEMNRELASYNKIIPDEKAVVQEYMEDDQAMKARFEEWMKEYGQTYKDEVEKARRFKIFKSVARYIDAANTDLAKAGHSVRFGLNHFSDRNAEERSGRYGTPTSGDDGYLTVVMSYLAQQWPRTRNSTIEEGKEVMVQRPTGYLVKINQKELVSVRLV